MSDENWAKGFAILVAVLCFMLFCVGRLHSDLLAKYNRIRTEALERGYAEWTPAREFRWIDNAE